MEELIHTGEEIGPQAVRTQVARICASEGFARCPRMRRFLEFVVEEKLAGRDDQIGEYAIGVSVFDRGNDFEPAIDPIVRNDARRLRTKLAEYYRVAGHPADRVLIEIAKGGYVPTFRGLAKTAETAIATADSAHRVAVLPFEVISLEPQDWKLGRALSLSLTASLTGMGGFEAIAHAFTNDLSAVGATHVVQGAICSFGECQLRVIVNLVRVADGTQLWAYHYDFEPRDRMAAHSEVVRTVVHELATRLSTRPKPALYLVAAA
jgi:TolB-like protein